MLTTPDNLLFLHLLDDDLQDKMLNHLSRDGGEADRPVVPWVLLLALFEDWSDIGFLQSSGASPVLQDLSKMMESSSAITSASSLSTYGCIPLGPMDLWVSRLLKRSLTQSSSTKGKSFSLWASSVASGAWDS